MSEQNDSQIKDDPPTYVKSLKVEQREDYEFLITQITAYWATHPSIVGHIFSRCKRLANNDKAKLDKLDALKMRWEIEQEQEQEQEHDEHQDKLHSSSASQSGEAQHMLSTLLGNQNYQALVSVMTKHAFKLIVILPVLLFSLYLSVFASDRYESQAMLVVKQPDGMATMDPSLALLTGLSGSASSVDTDLVKAYILSNDMLEHLEQKIDYSSHFAEQSNDPFSKLSKSATRETRLAYLAEHVSVELDPVSSIITITAQAFEPHYAKLITQTITQRSEYFINKIGHDLAKAQLSFVQKEHELVQQKLQNAQSKLLAFQRKYNLLDPEAEGMALQQITFEIEGRIASKSAELNALRSSMSESAPMVRQAQDQLDSLQQQLATERDRLTRNVIDDAEEGQEPLGVNGVLSKFSDYKINLEFALQAYTASKISLEKSRIQAYQQLKYLVTIESPTQPEEAKYPKIFYNIVLLLVILLVLFAIGKMIVATADELR